MKMNCLFIGGPAHGKVKLVDPIPVLKMYQARDLSVEPYRLDGIAPELPDLAVYKKEIEKRRAWTEPHQWGRRIYVVSFVVYYMSELEGSKKNREHEDMIDQAYLRGELTTNYSSFVDFQ